MIKRTVRALSLVLVGLVCATAAQAEEPMMLAGSGGGRRDRSVNRRQDRQSDRVQQGVQSGQLTKAELARVAAHEKRISTLEARLRLGGLNAAERARLQAELTRESEEIRRLKHNDRTQPAAPRAR